MQSNDTYSGTVGADFSLKNHIYYDDDKKINIRYLIYDLAGQTKYTSIRTQYMAGAQTSLLVYDISNRTSFENINQWIKQFKQVIKNDVPLILIANKMDLRENDDIDTISSAEGEKLTEKLNEIYKIQDEYKIIYLETSALENKNIDEAFNIISKSIYMTSIKNNPFI